MKTLECSSAGDKRFSAMYAKVKVFGSLDTIENHYQAVKVFSVNGSIQSVDKPKGKKPVCCLIKNKLLDVDYLTSWYYLLWLIYLDSNPELVKYAATFDKYNDRFRGKSINCQADAIRIYVKQGREMLLHFVTPLLDELKLVYVCMMGEWLLSNRLFTIGYASLGPNGENAVCKLMEISNRYNATIVDVRFNPYSGYYKVFDNDSLMRRGIAYTWIKSLGNKSRDVNDIVLVNEQHGLRILKSMLQFDFRNVILMCSEKDPRKCHRRYIARQLFPRDLIVHLMERS